MPRDQTQAAGPSPAVGWGHAGVFGDVEHAHVRGGRFRGDDELVLRHVARSIHLSIVVDLHRYLHLASGGEGGVTRWWMSRSAGDHRNAGSHPTG